MTDGDKKILFGDPNAPRPQGVIYAAALIEEEKALMTPDEAAQILADAMNRIEADGFLLYPHPRPIGISIRVLREGKKIAFHPDDTRVVATVWDEGDGDGWRVKE